LIFLAEAILESAHRQRVAMRGDLWRAATGWEERTFLARWMVLPLSVAQEAHEAAHSNAQPNRRSFPAWLYLARGARYLKHKLFSTKPSTHQP
jgi:hypothetical protein